MGKGDKRLVDITTNELAKTGDELSRKMNPMARFEVSAIKAARELERKMNPMAGIETAALRAARDMNRRMNPFGGLRLHQSMAEQMTGLAVGGSLAETVKANLGVSLAFPAGPGTSLLAVQRALQKQCGLGGIDDLRRNVSALVGSSTLLAAVDPFVKARDGIGGLLGAPAAASWDRIGAQLALPSIARLASDFEKPAAVMTVRPDGDILGAITWLAPSESYGAEGDAPPGAVVRVAALSRVAPADEKAWPKLRNATGSAINCKECGRPFDLELDIFLVGDDSAFFQGEMFTGSCPRCSGEEEQLPDESTVPPLAILQGNDEGDGEPAGRVWLIVNNPRGDEYDGD